MTPLETADEVDLRVEELLEKLRAWLAVQPGWVYFLSADRKTRKRVADLVAKELTTVPTATPEGWNREIRRAVLRELKHGEFGL